MSVLRAWSSGLARELWLRISDTGILGYRHVLDSPTGFSSGYPQTILMDLSVFPPLSDGVMLVSHPYRSSFIPHYPCIETWALSQGVTRCQAEPYRSIQFHTIRKQLTKPQRKLGGSFAVFPHITSHFGHWVGDQLGAFLWYARNLCTLPEKPRLVAISPSPEWARFLAEFCPKGSLFFISPQKYLEVNWVLERAIVLPRLSPWQNLSILRDCLGPQLSGWVAQPTESQIPGRIFLCSQRQDRILNLEAVEGIFREHGYAVINPTSYSPQHLLRLIRQASSLWCEQGSMVMNTLLARDRPYRLFELNTLNSSRYPRQLHMLGGGIYNSFHLALIIPFYCQPAAESSHLDRQLHPYQRQLVVDLDALRQELANEVRAG